MIVAIIQARMKSTRLPGKALADIAGRPLIHHVIERALAIVGVNRVALNVPLSDMSYFDGIHFHPRFSVHGVPNQEEDVLKSFLTVAEREGADVIMRLTGDCALICPELCGRVLDLFLKLNSPDVYCANDTLKSGFPDGTDVEVFSTSLLMNTSYLATDAYQRQHVTTYIRSSSDNFGYLAPLGWQPELKDVKLKIGRASCRERV